MKKNLVPLESEMLIPTICNEGEKEFEKVEIFLDEPLLKDLKQKCMTKVDVPVVKEIIRTRVEDIFTKLLNSKASELFSPGHIARITLYANGKNTLHICSMAEKETINYDGIRHIDENNSENIMYSRKNLFEKYNADTIVVDGLTIIENRMINLPSAVSQTKVSKDAIIQLVQKNHLSLTAEEALTLLNAPICQLPIKEDVIRWVRDKSNAYIEAQLCKEDAEKSIAQAHERREKFFKLFDQKYNELQLIVYVLEYKDYCLAYPNRNQCHMFLEMRIRNLAAELLLIIHDMTEYDLSDCFDA